MGVAPQAAERRLVGGAVAKALGDAVPTLGTAGLCAATLALVSRRRGRA